MTDAIVHVLLSMSNVVRLYHWSTRVYARHVATDTMLSELSDKVDRLVETFIARYGRPSFGGELTLHLPLLSDEEAVTKLREYARWLRLDFPKLLKPEATTEFLNQRDDILALIDRTLYRFTLE